MKLKMFVFAVFDTMTPSLVYFHKKEGFMSNERYVCPKVAAMEVNVNAETIRRWLREGKIPGKKIAGT